MKKIKPDYLYYTHRIEMLNFAEARAKDPVMRKMWGMKARHLFDKRTEWLEKKCSELTRKKAE